MFLRPVLNNIKLWTPNIRGISGQSLLVDLRTDSEGISTMTLQRPPVNSINLTMLQEISKSLDQVSKNKSKGLILTSSSPTVFTAGVDIMEMYKPDLKRLEEFCTTLQEVWLKLFGSSFVTAAAVNGHAPAAGCLLAMSCEYRVMVAGKYTIGLNETALGIVPITWAIDTMCHTLPIREAEYALTTAKMFTVDEALKVGLIDEVAADKEEAISKCRVFIKKFDKIPVRARSLIKLKVRESALKKTQANPKAVVEEFLTQLKKPEVQQNLEMYIQLLKKKSAK